MHRNQNVPSYWQPAGNIDIGSTRTRFVNQHRNVNNRNERDQNTGNRNVSSQGVRSGVRSGVHRKRNEPSKFDRTAKTANLIAINSRDAKKVMNRNNKLHEHWHAEPHIAEQESEISENFFSNITFMGLVYDPQLSGMDVLTEDINSHYVDTNELSDNIIYSNPRENATFISNSLGEFEIERNLLSGVSKELNEAENNVPLPISMGDFNISQHFIGAPSLVKVSLAQLHPSY